jgi:competence protein ComEA
MNLSVLSERSFSSRSWRCALLVAVLALFTFTVFTEPSSGQDRSMPDGPGKEQTRKLCVQCHELEKSFSIHQDQAGWKRTVDKMVAFGMEGTEEEIRSVLDYLVRNYPADEVPKINVNKARAIELESGLSLRRSHAAAIIEYRDKHGDFKSIEDLKKVPGVDVAKIVAKKDRLIFK